MLGNKSIKKCANEFMGKARESETFLAASVSQLSDKQKS